MLWFSGIDSNTVVVDLEDELDKDLEEATIAEKAREIIVNGEVLTGKSLEDTEDRVDKEELEEQDKLNTATGHDMLSNINLVVDDVEVKSTMDLSSKEDLEKKQTISERKLECNIDSEVEKEADKMEQKDLNVNKTEDKCREQNSSEGEVVLSQSSTLSEGSVEWTVVDSIETSEDESSIINSQENKKIDQEIVGLEIGTSTTNRGKYYSM